ncbi:hypothetical protein B0H14DRAFT_2641348, partial [Mycena olivaceomarginata]
MNGNLSKPLFAVLLSLPGYIPWIYIGGGAVEAWWRGRVLDTMPQLEQVWRYIDVGSSRGGSQVTVAELPTVVRNGSSEPAGRQQDADLAVGQSKRLLPQSQNGEGG